jgi:hypothetical protein
LWDLFIIIYFSHNFPRAKTQKQGKTPIKVRKSYHHPTMFSPAAFKFTTAVDQTLRVNTSKLWKVTLGFLPAYANLYRRLYDQHGLDRLELQEARAMLKTLVEREMKRNGKDITDAMDSNISEHAIKEILASSDDLPSADWSDISDSTGGWSNSSSTNFSGDSQSSSGWTSGSESSDSSIWMSDYLFWRQAPDSADLGWMERVSRAVFGEI